MNGEAKLISETQPAYQEVAANEQGKSNVRETAGESPHPLIHLIGNIDAKVWAEEFNTSLANQGIQPLDPGFLIGWFANALMAGYDHHRWKQEKNQ